MPYAPCVVLALPLSDEAALAGFVESCLEDGVQLIAVAGQDAVRVEAKIDRLVIGDRSDPERFIVTSVHADGQKAAMVFAKNWETGDERPPDVVRL